MPYREVLLMERYQCKTRNSERGNACKLIADWNLNLDFHFFTENTFLRVNDRAVRERCVLLINRQAKEEKSELNQSGISPAGNLSYKTIKSIIYRMRECEEEQENQDNANTKKLLCLLHEEKVLKTYFLLIFCCLLTSDH